MSQATASALPPADSIAATVSAALFALMSNTPTVTPSAARRAAIARPMPLPAPVTIALLRCSPLIRCSPGPTLRRRASRAVAPDDRNGAHVLVRMSAEVLRQAAVEGFQLP